MPPLPLPLIALILVAAFLHAGWNILAKSARDPFLGVTLLISLTSLIALPAAFFVPFPAPASWPYLLGSVVTHAIYNLLLGYGYRWADLTLVYPLSRGTAPLMIAASAWLIAGEAQSPLALAGIVVLSLGILSFAVERGHAAHARGLLIGLALGVTIMSYQLIDGLGVRVAGNRFSYIVWLFLPEGPSLLLLCLFLKRLDIFAFAKANWRSMTGGAVMSTLSYAIAVYAASRGALAHVAALRETSALFGTILGVALLKEQMRPIRYVGAGLVSLGAILLASAA
ncbi:MAG TPA: EamA family transporter [Dongiaceae bacterium]|jgi:drug/metabolite transporter (DMT)-like permease|nr:EamA family transporter [Dongiaceae bacterium]